LLSGASLIAQTGETLFGPETKAVFNFTFPILTDGSRLSQPLHRGVEASNEELIAMLEQKVIPFELIVGRHARSGYLRARGLFSTVDGRIYQFEVPPFMLSSSTLTRKFIAMLDNYYGQVMNMGIGDMDFATYRGYVDPDGLDARGYPLGFPSQALIIGAE